MLSILAFFIYGTGVIKDFMLALVVGIVAGTYSSIYVAAPMTEWIDERMTKGAKKKRAGARPKASRAKTVRTRTYHLRPARPRPQPVPGSRPSSWSGAAPAPGRPWWNVR